MYDKETAGDYAAVYQEAYRAGQLAMRERAALIAERYLGTKADPDLVTVLAQMLGGLADIPTHIRALEPEEPK